MGKNIYEAANLHTLGAYNAQKVAQKSESLQFNWSKMLAEFGIAANVSNELFQQVAAQYSSEGRYYHTLKHIYDTLAFAEKLADYYHIDVTEKISLQLAIWFHDIVYDTHAADNEEKSAMYTQQMLQPLGLPTSLIERVSRLIVSTKTHRPLALNDTTNQILLDADLSILGAASPNYTAYSLAIRKEYSWVGEAEFKAGRKAVLEKFLERPNLYFTSYASEHLEATARSNLQREIATLDLA